MINGIGHAGSHSPSHWNVGVSSLQCPRDAAKMTSAARVFPFPAAAWYQRCYTVKRISLHPASSHSIDISLFRPFIMHRWYFIFFFYCPARNGENWSRPDSFADTYRHRHQSLCSYLSTYMITCIERERERGIWVIVASFKQTRGRLKRKITCLPVHCSWPAVLRLLWIYLEPTSRGCKAFPPVNPPTPAAAAAALGSLLRTNFNLIRPPSIGGTEHSVTSLTFHHAKTPAISWIWII